MSDWYERPYQGTGYSIVPKDSDISHKAHKYIEKKMGKNGKWIYVYNRPSKGNSLRDKREADRTLTTKNLENFFIKNTKVGRMATVISNVRESANNKTLQEKENKVKELEAQLEEANKTGSYMNVNTAVGSGGAYDVNIKSKAEIERELIQARSELASEKNKYYAKHSGIEGSGYVIVPKDSDLLHHGRLGQKWGERNGPPYPLKLTGGQYKKLQKSVKKVADKFADREVYREEKEKKKEAKALAKQQKKADKKYAKEQKKLAKDAEAREKDKAKTQAAKEAAVRHNSYQELYAIKDKLTYQQLQDAFNRIDLEQKIYNKANPKQPDIWDKIDNVSGKLGKISNLVNKSKPIIDMFTGAIKEKQAKSSNQNQQQKKETTQNTQKQTQSTKQEKKQSSKKSSSSSGWYYQPKMTTLQIEQKKKKK